MRFVVLFAAACAFGCVAEAAVAPELGYVKLLTGEKDLKFCDGTICSGGCCPEPGFDCCSDGSHCANNVANCPGCPKGDDGTGVTSGGWCKVNVDEHGELTEDDPCCVYDPDTPTYEYCVHDDTDFSGSCKGDANEFCDESGQIKCGHDCCEEGTETCCPDKQCATITDGTECDYYCGGDVCGPEPNAINGLDPGTNPDDAQDCCLPPYECCQDGTSTCSNAGTPACGTPTLLCGSNPNTAFDCTTADFECCPNELPGCYDPADPPTMYTMCPGTECGTGNYCVGPKPYCCDDGMTCAAHPDECTSDPGPTCGTDTCTVGETCCNDICDTGVNLVCCVTSTDMANSCASDEDCCPANSRTDCCPTGNTCCVTGSVGANDCEATASDCDVTPK